MLNEHFEISNIEIQSSSSLLSMSQEPPPVIRLLVFEIALPKFERIRSASKSLDSKLITRTPVEIEAIPANPKRDKRRIA